MSEVKKYRMRIDNSICDAVKLKNPTNCWELDCKTPKTQQWYDDNFPHNYGVLYCHINPNDTVDRKVILYIDPKKKNKHISRHEMDITEFNVTPKMLYELLKDTDYIEKICVTLLDNIEYIFPNIIKRDKILNDGETYCMVNNLKDPFYPQMIKDKLNKFDNSDHPDNFIPAELSSIGKVTGLHTNQLYPVEVTFPNGYKGQFTVDQLIFFHAL